MEFYSQLLNVSGQNRHRNITLKAVNTMAWTHIQTMYFQGINRRFYCWMLMSLVGEIFSALLLKGCHKNKKLLGMHYSGCSGLAHSGVGCRTHHHDGDLRRTPRSCTGCAVRMSESHADLMSNIQVSGIILDLFLWLVYQSTLYFPLLRVGAII